MHGSAVFLQDNVTPDPSKNCGPYQPVSENDPDLNEYNIAKSYNYYNVKNHDTIGMIVIDSQNKIVAGTSTNGASHKIPG